MSWLIMNDTVDYPVTFYPTHVITEDQDIVPVFIGAASVIQSGFIGIYVRQEDYEKIRHDKAYLFIHDPDVVKDDIEEIEWDKVPDSKSKLSASREHIHIWKEEEELHEV